MSVDSLVACNVTDWSCDSDRVSPEFCCAWKVWSSLTKLLLARSCMLSFVFLWRWCHCHGFNGTSLLKQHICTYMGVRECVSPGSSLCMQELYTGGKDCNILAWVPVLRSPDMEEESNGTNKVGNRITCFRVDCETSGCIIIIIIILECFELLSSHDRQ